MLVNSSSVLATQTILTKFALKRNLGQRIISNAQGIIMKKRIRKLNPYFGQTPQKSVLRLFNIRVL